MRYLATIWKAWKKVGQFIGDIIGRAFLMLFYVTVTLPFGLGVRLFGDPLKIKSATPHWVERTSPEPTIEASYNQF
jgi:hypothetical protein